MKDRTFLEMWQPIRRQFIASHKFYVEQAKKRLLSQFDNMDEEAEKYADEWLEKNDHNFDPDRDDPADFYEYANEASIDFYLSLSDLKKQIRFTIIAGMYHQWDKQLREWMIHESRHSTLDVFMKENIWNVSFNNIFQLLAGCGWDVFNEKFYSPLNACRLIVNVYKHGNGEAFDMIKKEYPEFIDDPFKNYGNMSRDYLDHTHLELTDEHLDDFADAITSFWEKFPERIMSSQITIMPKWLKKGNIKKE